MSALSIVHVLSSFDTGGQERVALDLATQQRAAGHQVRAVSLARTGEGHLAGAFLAADVTTDTVAKGPGFDPTLPFRLAAYLSKARVDVVHSHNPHALIYGAPAARLVRAAAVHTKHGLNPDSARRRWLRRAAAKWVDAYVAVTERLGQVALDNRECAPERLHVVANGIDAARFAPNREARRRTRAALGIPEHAWVVGTVGRLSPEKDQALLIDAMTPLLDRERQLVIVGDGPEREPLSLRIAATWRSEFVHMTGARKDPENLLAAFDVFALSSRSEGLPLVVLEAMAMGVPVVCTAVGGVPDVVEPGVSGTLIAPRDRAALAKQLTWLATRPEAASQMASTAQRRVLERYTTPRMAKEYERLYEELVSDAAHTAHAPRSLAR